MNIVTLFVIVIGASLILNWFFYNFIFKLLWSLPVMVMIAAGYLVYIEVIKITTEPTLMKKLELYLNNDSSMGFYYLYLPIVVINVIITLIAYLLNSFKKRQY